MQNQTKSNRFICLFLWAFFLGFFNPLQGNAYVLNGAYWDDDWPVVPYYINAASFPSSVGTEQEIIDAIKKGANHWTFESGAKITYIYMGTTTLTTRSADGTNVFYYDPDVCDAPQGDCIGFVQWWPATGPLTDFDFTYFGKKNPGEPVSWDAVDPLFTGHDVWGVAAHEFGHSLGLSHTSSPNYATMNTTYYAQSATFYRFLTSDDIAGAQDLYGVNTDILVNDTEVNPGQIVSVSMDFADSANLSYEFFSSQNGTSPGKDMSLSDPLDYRFMDLNEPFEDMPAEPNVYQDTTGTLDTQGQATMTWDTTGLGGVCLHFAAQVEDTNYGWPNDIRHISDSIQVCVDACPADIDNDDTVGINDELAVLAAWGPCPGCEEDIIVNDAVDINDFLALLAAWGPCP